MFSGIGALLCHHPYCFTSQSQTLFGIDAGLLKAGLDYGLTCRCKFDACFPSDGWFLKGNCNFDGLQEKVFLMIPLTRLVNSWQLQLWQKWENKQNKTCSTLFDQFRCCHCMTDIVKFIEKGNVIVAKSNNKNKKWDCLFINGYNQKYPYRGSKKNILYSTK